CHPMGIVTNAWLAAMVLLDWRRIRWGALVAASLPYMLGVACCLYYIHQAPDLFLVQSRAASQYRGTGLGAILRNIFNDASQRYIRYYYVGYTGINKLKIASLILPVGGVIGLLADRDLRSQPLGKRLLLLACIAYVGVAVIDNQKFGNYLVLSVPVLTACGAVWAYARWQEGGRSRLLACCLIAISIGATIGGVGYKIYKNEYHNLYNPAVAAIRNSLPPGGLVMGGSELGFALGFGPPLVDDRYLGFFSGKAPDVFVVGEYYKPPWRSSRLNRAWEYSQSTLHNQYHLTFENKAYSVYVRNEVPISPQPANCSVLKGQWPLIDTTLEVRPPETS